ncbi:sulfite exporter TauE/SafE family protein [Streptomyces europaeiscabiei]|uniref:sulfite exporter TauE/SafE family protein n=1 Tax=Streptomyces europaeiscabiei TaxID=146819 RepID=UPI003990D1A1
MAKLPYIPGTVLLLAFALMMIATAVAMIRGRRQQPKKVHHELPVVHVLLEGIVVGLVTGLVGAGGGFLVVPALALLGGLPMTVAVGTSLLVISMKSFAGLAGYLAGRAHRLRVRRPCDGNRRRRQRDRRPPLRAHPPGRAAQVLRLVRRRHGRLRPRAAD